MSFYVNLPSNSSMNYYPSNTLQNFRTKLETPIKLDGNYEVGLCEIYFPKDFEIFIGHVYIIYNNKNSDEDHHINIYTNDNKPLKTLLNDLNSQIELIIGKNKIKVELGVKEIITLEMEKNYEIEFSNSLKELLMLKNERFNKSSEISFKIQENTTINLSPAIYVYCDIIDHQIVGDTQAQLLRTCNIQSKNEFYNHYIYDSPHYVKVNRKLITDINISFFFDTGDIVKFRQGKKVFVKLHFRPTI